MNYAIVFRLLGYILMIEGALLLLPAVTSLIYAEWAVMGVFLLTAAISAALGLGLRTIKPRSKVFYMREGFAATALSWIAISIVGAVPFVLTGCIPNPVDALFETVSGFTTTGASILPGVEGLPNGILFWRSFTHWIGGMGVLVFLLSLLPLTGGSHVNLMKAESPGPQVDKLVPKVQSTAKILYGIYFALTVVEFCFLLAGGMNVFDSMLTAFGTAGTGGFGFKNDSFASFSPYIQWVVTIFMILFGVNFNAYFLLLLRRFRRAAASEEVRGYFLIILVATMTAWIMALLLHLQPVQFPALSLTLPEEIVFRLLASFGGVFGFSLMFNSPRNLAVCAALIGAVTNTFRLELVSLAGFPPAVAAFLGALLSGLLASCLKSAVGYPRISVTVPSIVIMVPGLYFYRAIYNLGILSLMDSATWFADAILIIVALPLGLIFARIVTDKTFRYCT